MEKRGSNTKKKILSLVIITILFPVHSITQDMYLSHYESAPQYLNPALTGMYFGKRNDYRININYASHTIGPLTNIFNTASVGYDTRIAKFGIGGCIINNNSGTSHFNNLNILVSGAYEITIDPTHRHNLIAGIQLGMLNRSLSRSDLQFESQYSYTKGGFESNIQSRENFKTTSIYSFDAGLGAFYKFKDRRKRLNPFLGFSIFHATMPNVSFYDDRYPYSFRFNIYGGTTIHINRLYHITPKCFALQHSKQQTIEAGSFVSRSFRNTISEMMLGILYNNNDIFSFHIGVKHNHNIYRISYGAHSSIRNQYGLGRSTLEVSVIISEQSNTNPSIK